MAMLLVKGYWTKYCWMVCEWIWWGNYLELFTGYPSIRNPSVYPGEVHFSGYLACPCHKEPNSTAQPLRDTSCLQPPLLSTTITTGCQDWCKCRIVIGNIISFRRKLWVTLVLLESVSLQSAKGPTSARFEPYFMCFFYGKARADCPGTVYYRPIKQ